MMRVLLVASVICLIIVPVGAFAHGTDYRLINNDAVAIAEFVYSDQTPMRYAEILVFSPGNDKVEFQNGRTDQNGRFAFLAETPGDWHVKVNDGMGHAVHATVSVNLGKLEQSFAAETSADGLNNAPEKTITGKKNFIFADTSVFIKLLFGLSILLNLSLGMYVCKCRSQKKTPFTDQ